MHDGRIKNINTKPSPVTLMILLLELLRKLGENGQPIPKPMYHGIWSASFFKDLKIEEITWY